MTTGELQVTVVDVARSVTVTVLLALGPLLVHRVVSLVV